MGSLDGKIAVVTGAGRGLGRCHALLLAREGAKVVVNDPGGEVDGTGDGSARPAEQVVQEIVEAGGEAVANLSSVTDWSAAEELIQQAVETYGDLNILVNNAGILRDKMSFNMDEEDWDSVMAVHLKGHFAPTHFAANYWRNKAKAGDGAYGRIINTSSESGLNGNAGQANYDTAKAGIASLTIALGRELGRYGVTANAIAPRARTRMTADLIKDFIPPPKEGEFDSWAPENVSPFVAWLAGPSAAHVNGQLFIVGGSKVHHIAPWVALNGITASHNMWTVAELDAAASKLFEGADPGKFPDRVD